MLSPVMLIRTLQPEDAAAYQALRLRGLAEVPTAFASSWEEEQGTPLEEVARRLRADETGAVFGALASSQLVGLAGVQRESMVKLRHRIPNWRRHFLRMQLVARWSAFRETK